VRPRPAAALFRPGARVAPVPTVTSNVRRHDSITRGPCDVAGAWL
jgi:hypothetical protein